MAIAHVQDKTNSNGATVNSLNIVLDAAPTNGNLLIAVVSSTVAIPVTIDSDSHITWFGNTKAGASSTWISVFYGVVRDGSASATIVLNVSGTGGAICGVISEFSGFTLPNLDRTVWATATSTSAASGATPTTRSANELWIGGIVARNTSGTTITSPTNGFTIAGTASTSTAVASDKTVGLLYKIVSSTGTANAGATIGASVVWVAHALTFDEGSTGGAAAVQTSHIFG